MNDLINKYLFYLIVVVFLIFIIYRVIKIRRPLKKLSGFLDGAVPRFPLGNSFEGEYQGQHISIILNPGGNHDFPYLKIMLFHKLPFTLSIFQGNLIANIWERMNAWGKKVDVAPFLVDYRIVSDNPTEATRYLSKDVIKEAISALFDKGFSVLSIDGECILIKKINYDVTVDLEKVTLLDTLSKLNMLGSGL